MSILFAHKHFLFVYSNPKWFVEVHLEGVRFHKPQKSTNDLGLL
jgi:hypothetical protein